VMAVSDGPELGRVGEELDEREREVWHMIAVRRWPQHRIATHFGISQQRVAQIKRNIIAKLPPVDRADMIRESVELHHSIIERMHELAEMNGAPVTAGKDGDVVIDPDTDQPVRDYSLRLNALGLAMKAEAELRKLLGLDSAQKVEHSGEVRYVIEGVDPGALS